MGFAPKPLHFLLLLLFVLAFIFTSSVTTLSAFEEPKVRHIGEVSGEEEIKLGVLESFRALLGISSNEGRQTHNKNPRKHRLSLSPAPAPAVAPAPVPSPRRPFPKAALPRAGRIHPESGLEEPPKAGKRDIVGRFLVVSIVSAGAALVILALAVVLACCRFKKLRRKRAAAAGSVGFSRSKFPSGSSSSLSKVSFDRGHDFTFLDSLDPPPPPKVSHGDSSNATSNSVVGEGDNASGDGGGGSAYETIAVESDSDDESFHSVCAPSDSSSCGLSVVSSASNASTRSRSKGSASPPPTVPSHEPTLSSPLSMTSTSSSSPSVSPPVQTQIVLHPLEVKPSIKSNSGHLAIPAPPPLPLKPAINGNSSIPRPPPPPIPQPPLPPPQPQQATAFAKDGTPLPKLKPLHWDKVRAPPDRSMVWDKLRSSSFELDEEMIESLFGYNLQSSGKNEEAKNKASLPSKHVLDHKRLQNVTILFKALNANAEQICMALIQGDGLSAQQLEVLVKMVPTKEEEEKLSNFKGDVRELGDAERLIKAMLIVPFTFARVDAMLYKDTFEDEVLHLRKSFEMLEDACKELRSSRLFLRLLEAVLKTGNRMNVGTIRGGARAFKLDALLKLADVKGTDGKTTLLHFVVQEMIRSEGQSASEAQSKPNKSGGDQEKEEHYSAVGLDLVSGLSSELCNVKKTASIDLDVLASSVSNLYDGLAKHKVLVEKDLDGKESFVDSMKRFLGRAEMEIEELKGEEEEVLVHVREITEYFHGDLGKDEANPLRIFVIVRDFLGMLDGVCREVRNSKGHQSFIPGTSFR
ncbi:Formin-like protein 11 [Acorus calamus]|uniref:Formin-like protein n=1 Tax=Acorus calamus TaxID=4465 RepID=A0AAV9EID3_ACOCL|nr:Formin-like protein 11 [Acorus calamus]